MNNINIIGRLTRKPELKQKDDKRWCRFDIAVNSFNDQDVSYFTVVTFDKLADVVVKFLDKGSKVGIDGYLRQRKYTSESGDNRSVIEINARNIYFLDDKKTKISDNNDDIELDDLIEEDDLPF